MSIFPLPQFETDLKEHLLEEDRKTYERLKAPTSIVVRFGAMKLVGEFPYDGEAKPGCGSKLVVRTHRGTELGEMLTSTCPNSGCSKSVSRQDMLKYIENSGGRDYPFFNNGKVLRIATKEDLDAQARIEQSKHELKMDARRRAEKFRSQARIVDAEPILGGERLTFYYYSEERLDVHLLHEDLQKAHPNTRIELKMVGARDEARLIADYEKCGQYCCCKNFLKVLKPVSMKSAKVQKATLDPLKISGRCGRLMCCLRYEDQTYEELAKRLPRKKSRVGTPEGDGIVIDAQILTQLVLVLLDNSDKRVAVPVEEITPPESAVAPPPPPMPPPRAPREARPADRPPARSQERPARPDRPTERAAERGPDRDPDRSPARTPDAPRPSRHEARRDDRPRAPRDADPSIVDFDDIPTDAGDGPDRRSRPHPAGGPDTPESREGGSGEGRRKRRRRRRGGSGGGSGGGGGGGGGSGGDGAGAGGSSASGPDGHPQRPASRPERPPQERGPQDGPMREPQAGGGEGGPRKKRRRRKRRPGGGPAGGPGGGPAGGPGGGAGGGNPAGDGGA
ncbi:MAG: hypothetical protein KF838_12275 [Phycisphaeraceae bacterium]|nr:MAG: hypothetical protein KF838_12275 [Phycisphaeraceae bacterium]